MYFPPPVSSAGVPMRTSVPGILNRSIATETPTADARDAVAIRLCPQACPMPGRASRFVPLSNDLQCQAGRRSWVNPTVFSIVANGPSTLSDCKPSFECSTNAIYTTLYRPTSRFEPITDEFASFHFLKHDLWVLPDLSRISMQSTNHRAGIFPRLD